VNAPWQSARHGRGLLLLRGEPGQVARWAARGLVASQVVPLPGWTAVVPAEPASRARPPYDDALTVLASRPVAHRLRSALGLFAVDGRAVVTVQSEAWRAVQRWLVWQPGRGLVRTPDLTPARPGDLVAAAHAGPRGAGPQVGELLRDPRGDALGLVDDLMAVLGLPGRELLHGGEPPAGQLVEPGGRGVAMFDALMSEEARHRAELEEES
jgi:hypothetical protein